MCAHKITPINEVIQDSLSELDQEVKANALVSDNGYFVNACFVKLMDVLACATNRGFDELTVNNKQIIDQRSAIRGIIFDNRYDLIASIAKSFPPKAVSMTLLLAFSLSDSVQTRICYRIWKKEYCEAGHRPISLWKLKSVASAIIHVSNV